MFNYDDFNIGYIPTQIIDAYKENKENNESTKENK